MREILSDLDNWFSKKEPVALATVVQTWGSSPRGLAAKMALTQDGKISGSVSGGCVEGAVFEAGVEVLRSGRPQLLHFGVADETAWSVGLACGGQVDVFVQPLDEAFFALQRSELRAGRSFVVATIIQGPAYLLGKDLLITRERRIYHSIAAGLDEAIVEQARQSLMSGISKTVRLETSVKESVDVFIEVQNPQPVLVMVGGVHIAIALTSIARSLGFRTIVIDPRKAFGSAERFSHADQLIQLWPDDAFENVALTEKTAIAILTHDPKIDDPALKIALSSPAFYVGALGSDTTQAKRRARLTEAGLSQDQLARLHGPIGLKLGASNPEEIALAVMAEIVAVQHKTIH
ncbi:MAG: XdhC family protein [Anaerolineaceae bacterium]|nr:XdhC family protein [Anaerolineaceae bacterium]